MSETETERTRDDSDVEPEKQGEDTYFVEITDQFTVEAAGDPRITCEKEAREHILRMINSGEYPCYNATVVGSHNDSDRANYTDKHRCTVDGCENKLLTYATDDVCIEHIFEVNDE